MFILDGPGKKIRLGKRVLKDLEEYEAYCTHIDADQKLEFDGREAIKLKGGEIFGRAVDWLGVVEDLRSASKLFIRIPYQKGKDLDQVLDDRTEPRSLIVGGRVWKTIPPTAGEKMSWLAKQLGSLDNVWKKIKLTERALKDLKGYESYWYRVEPNKRFEFTGEKNKRNLIIRIRNPKAVLWKSSKLGSFD